MIVPSLAHQHRRARAERDGQVPRFCPKGGRSVNENTIHKVLGSWVLGVRLCARSRILFVNADSGCDSVDAMSVQLPNRYIISVTIM